MPDQLTPEVLMDAFVTLERGAQHLPVLFAHPQHYREVMKALGMRPTWVLRMEDKVAQLNRRLPATPVVTKEEDPDERLFEPRAP